MAIRNFYLTTSILLTLLASVLSADARSKKVRNVEGVCEITRSLSLEQAEQKALEDAKINAMRAAGVPERLWSVSGLISEDDGSEFSQTLSRMITLEVNGFITIQDVDYSERTVNGLRYAVATIVEADVKYDNTEVDPTFQIDMKDIKGIYEDGSPVTFSLTVYGHDAYIKLFWFDATGGAEIYPSEYERNILFNKERKYQFPLNPAIDYTASKTDRSAKSETVNLIAVATKDNIPFLEDEVSFDSVLKWIYSIPADKRAAYREAIIIH